MAIKIETSTRLRSGEIVKRRKRAESGRYETRETTCNAGISVKICCVDWLASAGILRSIYLLYVSPSSSYLTARFSLSLLALRRRRREWVPVHGRVISWQSDQKRALERRQASPSARKRSLLFVCRIIFSFAPGARTDDVTASSRATFRSPPSGARPCRCEQNGDGPTGRD